MLRSAAEVHFGEAALQRRDTRAPPIDAKIASKDGALPKIIASVFL
ncbi:MAG: hypothetical protein ABJH45_10855 [Paracoccaceae bacterium]